MTIGIIASAEQQEALQKQGIAADIQTEWLDAPRHIPGAAAIIDFLNRKDQYPVEWLSASSTLLFINQVEEPIDQSPAHFIRFNGWPGCWERPLLEASCNVPEIQSAAEKIIATAFSKKISWVNDIPGFLTARVLAGIINEGYLALGEGVSSKEDIDTAMKLGTNYPYGPFEWAERIGINRIYSLLNHLSINHPQYQPAPLLKQEAGN